MERFTFALSHYLIPGYSNDQRAKTLHPPTLLFVVIALIVYQIFLQTLPLTGAKVLGYAANIPVEKVIEVTNKKRQEAGLSPLSSSPHLAQAALAKGNDMLANDYWAHVSPGGTEPWKFFLDAGYKYRYAGENLARDFSSAEAAVDAWMASPSHKENLLSSKYKEIGIAVVEGDLAGVDTTIIVQLFGTPYVDTLPQVPVASAEKQNNQVATAVQKPTPTEAIVTLTPTVTPVQLIASGQNETGASTSNKTQILISPFTSTKSISIATTFLFLIVLVIDGVIAARKKITRIHGRNFAHLAFLVMILLSILLVESGSIM